MTVAVDPEARQIRPCGFPRSPGRSSVRDPFDPMIYLPVIIPGDNGDFERAELVMTVSQAIEVMGAYAKTIGDFCKRADVRDALLRTDPGSVFSRPKRATSDPGSVACDR